MKIIARTNITSMLNNDNTSRISGQSTRLFGQSMHSISSLICWSKNFSCKDGWSRNRDYCHKCR